MKTDSAAVREVPAGRIAHLSTYEEACPRCGWPFLLMVFGLQPPSLVHIFSAGEGEDAEALGKRIRQGLLEVAREAGIRTLDADRIVEGKSGRAGRRLFISRVRPNRSIHDWGIAMC